jgi:hypothetical protein
MDRARKKLKGKIATKRDNDSIELINNGDINKLDDGIWLNDNDICCFPMDVCFDGGEEVGGHNRRFI